MSDFLIPCVLMDNMHLGLPPLVMVNQQPVKTSGFQRYRWKRWSANSAWYVVIENITDLFSAYILLLFTSDPNNPAATHHSLHTCNNWNGAMSPCPHMVRVRFWDKAISWGRVVRVWAYTPLNNMHVIIYIYNLLRPYSCPTPLLSLVYIYVPSYS